MLGLVDKRFYNLHVTACLPITTMHEVSLLIPKDIMQRILRDYFLQSFPLYASFLQKYTQTNTTIERCNMGKYLHREKILHVRTTVNWTFIDGVLDHMYKDLNGWEDRSMKKLFLSWIVQRMKMLDDMFNIPLKIRYF